MPGQHQKEIFLEEEPPSASEVVCTTIPSLLLLEMQTAPHLHFCGLNVDGLR